nr:hypothetical protein [Tanacetum cinerariifolium]
MLGLLNRHWSLLHLNDLISLYYFQAFHYDAIMGQMLDQFQENQRDYFLNAHLEVVLLYLVPVYYEVTPLDIFPLRHVFEGVTSKTRADYGSGVARPKIEDKCNFELKGQFLKELRTNTFSGSDHEDANEHIKKVIKIVNLFHISNITIDQVMLRAFLMSLTGAKMEEINKSQEEPDENLYQAWEQFKELLMKYPQHYLMEMQEVILFYNGLGILTRQILDSRGAIPSKTAADAKIKKVNEKVYAAQVGCEQCKGPHYTKDCPIKEERKTLKEAYYTQFGGPFQGGGYRAATPELYQRNNVNTSYQEQRKFYNSIIKDKMVYKGNNVIGALMNVPIFVGTFFVVTDFAILKNMDAYCDEGMGDVIFGEPFLREVGIKTKRFEGMITIYNGNDEVTYQVVRSHPRFKLHSNKQCNKIPPLLKVSNEDKKNGISHPYQKLKRFYKGVLNLEPDYIRDAKTKEWITCEHINVHEMEW